MAGVDRMTIEEVVRKVLVDDHADVIRESVRWVAQQLMEQKKRRRTKTITLGRAHFKIRGKGSAKLNSPDQGGQEAPRR